MAKTPSTGLAGMIRDAIEDSGLTRYQIAKESGIAEASLSRLMHGRDPKASTVDAILDTLDLEIVIRKRRRGSSSR